MTTPATPPTSARLALEDGAIFHGSAFGCTSRPGPDHARPVPITITGEVVFNTAMTGYQEALTDPSYSGQILTMTAPQIGNYGINAEDVESSTIHVAGFVIRELSRVVSNYRASIDLSAWLARAGILGIQGIDTRALTRKLRISGAMRGALSADPSLSDSELIDIARASPSMAGQNLVPNVSTTTPATWTESLGSWADSTAASTLSPQPHRRFRVVALDCGAKRNIFRHLATRNCEVIILPHDASAEQIRAARPDGLFISNGPGDPAAVDATINTLRQVAGEIPTFGICLGHQLLCLALGGSTFKLKFGHRGANQPVRNLLTGRVEITSQNHGFAVDPDSIIAADCQPTHVNLNDGTLAGFLHRSKPIFAVQYHPEASPGPHDASYLFDCFIHLMSSRKPLTADIMRQLQSAPAHDLPAPAPVA